MVNIGKLNKLRVSRIADLGVYLDGGEIFGDILLPHHEAYKEYKIGDLVDVFIYFGSKDDIMATTAIPKAMVGDFALLTVVAVTPAGAFLEWDVPKDLFVPRCEQSVKMRRGQSYIVRIYLDKMTNRIKASSKIGKFLDGHPENYKEEQRVSLLLYDQTDIGYKAIIDNAFVGILYKNEVFQRLNRGQKLDGFIKKVRDDGKIDLSLYKRHYEDVTELSTKIIDKLLEHDGFVAANDKSSPETIYKLFGVSKKIYKKAIGTLYKRRAIFMENSGIRLNSKAINTHTSSAKHLTKHKISRPANG